MTAIVILLVGYASLSLVYWLWMAYGAVRLIQTVPWLGKVQAAEPEHWPRLAVVVPACNEADELKAAAQTLLDEDYPNLEIVLVDDRSTDQTGQIIDGLAKQDERVKAVHISKLPEGWLGKVHALNTGLGKSSGEFVLFTDADVHFNKGTLRKAVSYCLEKKLDHLAGVPQRWRTGMVLDSVILVFLRSFFVLMSRPWAACNPKSKAYLGIGAFNMVRRAAFEASEGFEWLRREVADDMGLGLLMKRSGARCGAVAAFENIGLHWYSSIGEANLGAEKAYATLSNFSVWRTVGVGLATLVMEMAPVLLLAALFFDKVRFVGYVGIAVFGVFIFSIITLSRWAKAKILPALLGPLTAWLLVAMLVRAGILGWRRGGVAWRGTLYSSGKLQSGKRVHFP